MGLLACSVPNTMARNAYPVIPEGAMAQPLLSSMAKILDLEPIERDLFRGENEPADTGLPNIFGGQIAAQALKAAGLTVDAERSPHSIHGYFLRPGRRSDPVVFKVERDRDGRSFSARRVRALQDGKVIFDLTASFHIDEQGGSLSPPIAAGVAGPDQCPPEAPVSNHPAVESRAVGGQEGPVGRRFSPTLWVRCRDDLGDNGLDHSCVLAYMSDISSGFAGAESITGAGGGPSIDIAMWFQTPVRTHEWLLLHMWPVLAGGARGLYQGTLHSREGAVGAIFSQQALLRPPATDSGSRPA
jgi:acyl-CoA thioesterase II